MAALLSACASAPTSSAAQPAAAAPTSTATAVPTATAAPTATPPPTATPFVEPRLGSPAFTQQNTPAANDLTPDGQSWSQSNPILIDAYGKIIISSQRSNGGDAVRIFVYSNDGGKTWQDESNPSPERYIERVSVAYDATNDLIHMLLIGASANDGVFYRRYKPSRDGAHNITAITRDEHANVVLDKQLTDTMQYQHPVMLHISNPAFEPYGALLSVWSVRNRGAHVGNELRASMCILGAQTTTCDVATTWSAPISPSQTSIGNAPQVAYSALLTNTKEDIPYASILQKQAGAHAEDIYVFYYDGGAPTSGIWAFERMRWNPQSKNWSSGLTPATTITMQRRAGTDTGYTLKQQLGTKPVEDTTNNRVYFGFANWKDDQSGDTWSFVAVDAAQDDKVSPIVDVYSAGGMHSYAPTGDITFDTTGQRLVVAYIKTGTQHIFLQLYDATKPTGSEIEAFSAAPVDIPLLATQARLGTPAKLLIVFRDTINTPKPPYHGWAGTLTWN